MVYFEILCLEYNLPPNWVSSIRYLRVLSSSNLKLWLLSTKGIILNCKSRKEMTQLELKVQSITDVNPTNL